MNSAPTVERTIYTLNYNLPPQHRIGLSRRNGIQSATAEGGSWRGVDHPTGLDGTPAKGTPLPAAASPLNYNLPIVSGAALQVAGLDHRGLGLDRFPGHGLLFVIFHLFSPRTLVCTILRP